MMAPVKKKKKKKERHNPVLAMETGTKVGHAIAATGVTASATAGIPSATVGEKAKRLVEACCIDFKSTCWGHGKSAV